MILYVFLLWFCAVGFVMLAELAVLSFHQPYTSAFGQKGPSLASSNPEIHPFALPLVIVLASLVTGVILAYWLEAFFAPLQLLYQKMQKRFPSWYRRWPADWREIYLAVLLGMTCLSVCLLLSLVFHSALTSWMFVPLGVGLLIGFLIRPVLKYRQLLQEDRPEKPPQAVLHHWVPRYPSSQALKIGQLYLRFLLPLFSLFCMLIIPMTLGTLEIQALEGGLVLGGLFAGLGIGWYTQRESHLDIQTFGNNLYQLSALSLLSAAFLIFGLASGNWAEMLFFSVFGGYLAGLY